MRFGQECRKIRRTGLVPAFLVGGATAGAIPILSQIFRPAQYSADGISPVGILMEASWPLMGLINVLLILTGAVILFHIEYADHAVRRMRALPGGDGRLFAGKASLMVLLSVLLLGLEGVALAFCGMFWSDAGPELWTEVLKNMAFELLLLLPSALFSLLISALFENMWIPLGIGVVCVLIATMIRDYPLTLFPFALPFQTMAGLKEGLSVRVGAAAGVESVLSLALTGLILKVRRAVE